MWGPGCDRMVVMQSVPITTNIVSSNPAHDKVLMSLSTIFQLYRGGQSY
jgi:hypothetical protein